MVYMYLLDMHQDLFGASTEDGSASMGDGAPNGLH